MSHLQCLLFLVLITVGITIVAVASLSGRPCKSILDPNLKVGDQVCENVAEDARKTREYYLQMNGPERDPDPGDLIAFGADSKEFMRLTADGQIEFKVPQKEAAEDFVKVVKKLWSEMCGCSGGKPHGR